MDELRAEYLELESKNTEKISQEIINNKGSLAALELLRIGTTLDKDKYFDTYLVVATQLNNDHPQNPMVIEFFRMVDNMKKLAVGQVAPEISLPNPCLLYTSDAADE